MRTKEKYPQYDEYYEQLYQYEQPQLPPPRHFPETVAVEPENGNEATLYLLKHSQKNEL